MIVLPEVCQEMGILPWLKSPRKPPPGHLYNPTFGMCEVPPTRGNPH